MPRIHPSAAVSADATLADDVTVGPFAVVDGPVVLGPGCVVMAQAHIMGRVTAGPGNTFHPGCVIGGRPQHLAEKGDETPVEIGTGNTFREHVTVHRGMPNGITRVGDRNYLMAASHLGHDVTVGDDCILVNSAVVGGHAVLEDRVLLSGNSGVHQHCRIGRLGLLSGMTGATQDIPPFFMVRYFNKIVGVNVVGMRRAGIPTAEIQAVRKAYRLMAALGLPPSAAVATMEQEYADSACVAELARFIRASKRGVPGPRQFGRDPDVGSAAA